MQYAPSPLSFSFVLIRKETRPDRDGSEQNALYRNDGVANQMSPINLFEIHIYSPELSCFERIPDNLICFYL
jgi:hypothetical protein